jgi:hypothetical protein
MLHAGVRNALARRDDSPEAAFTSWGGENCEDALSNSDRLRARGRRCRELLKVASKPEIVTQLKIWAREFDYEAYRLERSPRRRSTRRQARTAAREPSKTARGRAGSRRVPWS